MPTYPPKPRLALSIGITGHRPNQLRQSEEARISAEIHVLLEQIEAAISQASKNNSDCFDQKPPRLSLVSNLAEGADRITAEAALAKGYRLEAALPFLRDEFENDFADDASKAHFRALLDKASAVLELPGNRAATARAYERASKVMLDHVAILVAVWGGEPSGGRGGTKATIDEAARRGMPIILIDAKGEKATEIRWRDFHTYPGRETVFEDLEVRQPSEVLPSVINKLISPPKGDDANEEQDHLKDYFQEKLRKIQKRQEWGWLMGLAGAKLPRLSDWSVTHPETLAEEAKTLTNSQEHELASAFGWADKLATYYAQIFRSAFVANFLLAAVSVVIVAVSILVQKSFHALPEEKWIFVSVELLCILGVVVNTRIGTKRNWHRRWLEAREVAERFRINASHAAAWRFPRAKQPHGKRLDGLVCESHAPLVRIAPRGAFC